MTFENLQKNISLLKPYCTSLYGSFKNKTLFDGRLTFIHVIRNPFDNIATMFFHPASGSRNLTETTDDCFSLCETVLLVKSRLDKEALFELRHEAFVDQPKAFLKNLCPFLGTEISEHYLNNCRDNVFKNPKKTRGDAPWTPELMKKVNSGISRFPFLQGYSFEES